jgi:hypothetical protein
VKLYLAATHGAHFLFDGRQCVLDPPYLLESYAYLKDWQRDLFLEPDPQAPPESFMLDSGAYTFMRGSEKAGNPDEIDWFEYAEGYAECVKRHEIDLFLGMDLDAIFDYDPEPVREIREHLESEAGKPCIPVWHATRGRDAFLDLVRRYDYVAIGGIGSGAGNEIKPRSYKHFPWFIERAHEHDCKIHGLGYTPWSATSCSRHPFDSVDSRSWKGSSFGTATIFDFTGHSIESYRPYVHYADGRHRDIDEHDMREWIKYVNYVDRVVPEYEPEVEGEHTDASPAG